MTNIPELTIKSTSETLKNVTPLPLKLTLNTFNKSIHCSIESRAGTTQINSTIYHSFLSCQPLTTPQNMSPTRTGNPFMALMEYLTFQTGALQVLVSKTPNKI